MYILVLYWLHWLVVSDLFSMVIVAAVEGDYVAESVYLAIW